jgi:Ni/Fe-hydrogenase subunit HybB-like protein
MVECSHFWAQCVQNDIPLLILKPHIVQGLCELLLGMSSISQCLHARIIQPIILGYFKAKVISIIEKINVTLWFTHKFMYEQLDWKFRHSTTHGKLLSDWEMLRL